MEQLKYKLIRSSRRTLALEIDKNAQLIVRSPQLLSIKKVKDFINEKQNWILKKQQQILEKKANRPKKQYINGEKFLYLGNEYPLNIVEKQYEPLFLLQDTFYLAKKYQKNASEIFKIWYKKTAEKLIPPRVKLYANKHNLTFNNIRITDATTRWGSCSTYNNLNFNLALIMADIDVIDYVIAHEVAHTIHKNHSSDFWQLVEVIKPNYKKHKEWLKNNAELLII